MDLATTWSKRATCLRGQYGAVYVDKDNHVLASGYNGAPRGVAHCTDTRRTRDLYEMHDGEWLSPMGCLMEDNHCIRAVHAEMNGIIQAVRTGVSLVGSRLT